MADGQSSGFSLTSVLDVIAKFALAAAGLAATWYFNTQEAERSKAQIAAADQVQLEETFARYFSQIHTQADGAAPAKPGAEPAAVKMSPTDQVSLAIATNAALDLKERHKRPEFLALLQAQSTPQQQAALRNVELQKEEASGGASSDDALAASVAQSAPADAAPAPDAPAPSKPVTTAGPPAIAPPPNPGELRARIGRNFGVEQDVWFAVAASYPLTDSASANAFAAQLRDQLSAKGVDVKVSIWRTRVSQNLAVCVGGAVTQAQAAQIAADLRAKGVVTDAFAQRNRGWEQQP